jgi:hypothetical protein
MFRTASERIEESGQRRPDVSPSAQHDKPDAYPGKSSYTPDPVWNGSIEELSIYTRLFLWKRFRPTTRRVIKNNLVQDVKGFTPFTEPIRFSIGTVF